MSTKTIINTKNAPAPIGPYNQAVKVNNMLFVSGQIAINPADSSLNTSKFLNFLNYNIFIKSFYAW